MSFYLNPSAPFQLPLPDIVEGDGNRLQLGNGTWVDLEKIVVFYFPSFGEGTAPEITMYIPYKGYLKELQLFSSSPAETNIVGQLVVGEENYEIELPKDETMVKIPLSNNIDHIPVSFTLLEGSSKKDINALLIFAKTFN